MACLCLLLNVALAGYASTIAAAVALVWSFLLAWYLRQQIRVSEDQEDPSFSVMTMLNYSYLATSISNSFHITTSVGRYFTGSSTKSLEPGEDFFGCCKVTTISCNNFHCFYCLWFITVYILSICASLFKYLFRSHLKQKEGREREL